MTLLIHEFFLFIRTKLYPLGHWLQTKVPFNTLAPLQLGGTVFPPSPLPLSSHVPVMVGILFLHTKHFDRSVLSYLIQLATNLVESIQTGRS